MTMKKIYLKRLVKILSLVLVVAAIVGVSQEYYMTNSSNTAIRLRGFYREDPKTLDVVVLGASEVYSGFNAPEFYKKTGVTSYPYAYEGRSYARGGMGNVRGRSYARGRMNARRDSMGRYSSDSRYSMDNREIVKELRTLMNDAPDDRTRQEFRQFISKMEQM